MSTETPLLYQPFAAVPALDRLGEELAINVPDNERIYSVVAGVAAVFAGLAGRSFAGTLLAVAGAALTMRGSTGHCALYSALGRPSVGAKPVPVAV